MLDIQLSNLTADVVKDGLYLSLLLLIHPYVGIIAEEQLSLIMPVQVLGLLTLFQQISLQLSAPWFDWHSRYLLVVTLLSLTLFLDPV